MLELLQCSSFATAMHVALDLNFRNCAHNQLICDACRRSLQSRQVAFGFSTTLLVARVHLHDLHLRAPDEKRFSHHSPLSTFPYLCAICPAAVFSIESLIAMPYLALKLPDKRRDAVLSTRALQNFCDCSECVHSDDCFDVACHNNFDICRTSSLERSCSLKMSLQKLRAASLSLFLSHIIVNDADNGVCCVECIPCFGVIFLNICHVPVLLPAKQVYCRQSQYSSSSESFIGTTSTGSAPKITLA